MAKPLKFRYVNEIVGSFVLLVLILTIAALVMTWQAQGWFERTYEVTLICPKEGSLGLTEGSTIEILGIRVGSVQRITVNDNGIIEAVGQIKGDFFDRFVKKDSKALVKKQFGVVGDAYVVIELGTGDPLPEEARKLWLQKDTELIELAESLVSKVENSLLKTIDEMGKAAVEYQAVGQELRNPDGNLQQFLQRLNEFADTLQRGQGLVARLLNDELMADDAHEIVKNVKAVLKEVEAATVDLTGAAKDAREILSEVHEILENAKGAVEDIKNTTIHLPAVAETVRRESQDLPGMVLQVQETLRQAEELIRGIQQHWLIRGYMTQPEPAAPIPPAAVTGEGKR